MPDCIGAEGTGIERLFDGAMDMMHLEGRQQAQDLGVLPLGPLSHPRFQQPVQGGELGGQIIRRQLGKDPGSLPLPVHCPAVVCPANHDRGRKSWRQRSKCCHTGQTPARRRRMPRRRPPWASYRWRHHGERPIAERLGRLGRTGLDEDRVRMRQRHRKMVPPAVNTADPPERLSKICPGMPRRRRQRHKDLAGPALRLLHAVGDNSPPAEDAVFIPKPGMDAFGGVPLPFDTPLVVFEDLIDNRNARIKLRADRQGTPTLPWEHGMQQDLCHRFAVDPKKTTSGTLAHTINMARSTDTVEYRPTLRSSASGVRLRISTPRRSDHQTLSVGILSPGDTG